MAQVIARARYDINGPALKTYKEPANRRMLKAEPNFPLMSFSAISPTYIGAAVVIKARPIPPKNLTMHRTIRESLNIVVIHGKSSGIPANSRLGLRPNLSITDPAKRHPGIEPSRKLEANHDPSSGVILRPIGDLSDIRRGSVGDGQDMCIAAHAIDTVIVIDATYCIYLQSFSLYILDNGALWKEIQKTEK
uniref:Uncharacterized protein n=1 Tax=Photinus pyralis TaxID=7054 RepID=A0A1Y1L2J8_PHOPY